MAYPKKMGEEKASKRVVAIAKRVQREQPDCEAIGILTGASAILLLAGFTDPKNRHVMHAAKRLRATLEEATPTLLGPFGDVEPEVREIPERDRAELQRIAPLFYEAKARMLLDVPPATFMLWLDGVELCGREEDHLLLTAPSGVRAWTARRYTKLIEENLSAVNEKIAGVRWVNWIPQGAEMYGPATTDKGAS